MKKCPYCGHENDEQEVICKRCKAEIPHEEPKTVESVKGSKRKRSE